MDKIKKADLMEKVVHELEDLRNNQEAIIRKLAQIEVDNIELSDKKLTKELPDMHQRIADNLDSITSIMEYFSESTENYNSTNNIAALKEQEIIDNLELDK